MSTLQKLLALFISGSILISSVPVYAAETTSLIEPAGSEEFAEPDDTVDNSDEDVNGSSESEDMVSESQTDISGGSQTDISGESRTDMVDENRDASVRPDSEAVTSDGNNISDSEIDAEAVNTEEGSADSDSST